MHITEIAAQGRRHFRFHRYLLASATKWCSKLSTQHSQHRLDIIFNLFADCTNPDMTWNSSNFFTNNIRSVLVDKHIFYVSNSNHKQNQLLFSKHLTMILFSNCRLKHSYFFSVNNYKSHTGPILRQNFLILYLTVHIHWATLIKISS